MSSWYVDPAYRNYAPLLTKIAQRHKDVTYLNISPATWTWPIIETQGFNSYCSGLFFSVPALSRVQSGTTIETISADISAIEGLPAAEVELLTRHARYGCLSLVCRTPGGPFPFILLPMRIRRGWIAPPAMQLVYCRDIEEFVGCAGQAVREVPNGYPRFGYMLDNDGRAVGLLLLLLLLLYSSRGPHRPRLADLTDTELVLYGP